MIVYVCDGCGVAAPATPRGEKPPAWYSRDVAFDAQGRELSPMRPLSERGNEVRREERHVCSRACIEVLSRRDGDCSAIFLGTSRIATREYREGDGIPAPPIVSMTVDVHEREILAQAISGRVLADAHVIPEGA